MAVFKFQKGDFWAGYIVEVGQKCGTTVLLANVPAFLKCAAERLLDKLVEEAAQACAEGAVDVLKQVVNVCYQEGLAEPCNNPKIPVTVPGPPSNH